jgi:hypothetical protein
MRTSLLANSLQAPRVVPNTASQMSSFGEEEKRSAQPSPKHAGAGVDSHLSLRVPAMQQNQPAAGHGVGFGHLLPALNGVAKANDSSERGMAITGQQPPQMQGRNMQSSSRSSSLGNLASSLCISWWFKNLSLNSAVTDVVCTFQIYLIRETVTHLRVSFCSMQQTGLHRWNGDAAAHCTTHYLLCRRG